MRRGGSVKVLVAVKPVRKVAFIVMPAPSSMSRSSLL